MGQRLVFIKNKQPIRCCQCNGILMLASSFVGSVKCHRCKTINDVHILSQSDVAQNTYLPVDRQLKSAHTKSVQSNNRDQESTR